MKQISILVFLLILVGAYWIYLESGVELTTPFQGKSAPSFEIKDEQGNSLNSADLKGSVVLLHFWATWCPPCVTEIPSLNQFQKQWPDGKFKLIALSVDENREDVSAFRKKVGFDFKVYGDPSNTVVDAYQTYKLPESFLIDKKGRVVRKIIGPQDWQSPMWKAEIERLINE